MIHKQKSFFLLRLTTDLILLSISFVFSAILAQSWQILLERSYMFVLLLMLNTVWHLSTNTAGFYEDYNIRDFPSQFLSLIKFSSIQAFTAIVFIFITKEDLFTRNFILYHSVFLVILVSIRSIVFRKAVKYLRRSGTNLKNLLVVGTSEIGEKFLRLIETSNLLGYRMAGCVYDQAASAGGGAPLHLGCIDELESIISRENIDEVIVALPGQDSPRMESVIRICNKNGLRTHIIPDYFNILSTRFRVGTLGSFPIITVRSEPLEEFHWRLLKRTFDITFSLIVIIAILSWLIPVIVIMQKLLSPGPVFFLQDRIGKNNRKFKCYKFRTMKVAPQPQRFVPAQRDDPRVTPFGKFLRKTNLDELPQFFNVLKGEMSIVGPRPHAIAYNEIYREYVEYIKLRHLVKPGITGWAQVNGLRGDVTDPVEQELRTKKRIEHDIWYIENWSFGLDMQIIFMTFWQIVRGNNQGM